MPEDWVKDLNESNRAFLNLVWPVIASQCGGGKIKPVEVWRGNALANDLDVLCGIDIWQTITGEGARGIASRVQFGPVNYQTFTIRLYRDTGAKTEYEKRLFAIESNGRFIYPYLTCQAYVTCKGVLLGVGVAKTVDIFDVIKQEKVLHRRSPNSGFMAIKWSDVKDCWVRNMDTQCAIVTNTQSAIVTKKLQQKVLFT